MKYKQLYLDAQVRFAGKLALMKYSFSDIDSILKSLYYSLDIGRGEVSPELYRAMTDKLEKAGSICHTMIFNFEEYAEEKATGQGRGQDLLH